MATFKEAVKMYGKEHFFDHLSVDIEAMTECLKNLNYHENSWLAEQDPKSDEAKLYLKMLDLLYFFDELKEIPKVHKKFKQCYNVWHEEPQNLANIYDLISEENWD